MKTFTIKLPEQLLAWVEAEAKRTGCSKSTVVREVLARHQQQKGESALSLVADLCGSVQSGKGDLATNKKHLKGFGK